jgi:putative PIG3 family NAD(P)H quinone oxidoreductase
MMGQAMMTAIAVEGGRGGPEALKPVRIPRPAPREGEILIRVSAAGVNRPDLLQRMGGYPPPPGAPDTLGLEVAGEVVESAGRWRAGDRVCALLGGGGYAEYAVVDSRHALPVPEGFNLVEAAGLPETVFTVWANVFEHGALQPGETLLVHGATSGIGVTAIQMAKAAGARVIATARGAGKAARARELGADLAIDASAEDFGPRVKAEGGADVVLDMVGGDYFGRELDALKTDGRLHRRPGRRRGGPADLPADAEAGRGHRINPSSPNGGREGPAGVGGGGTGLALDRLRPVQPRH